MNQVATQTATVADTALAVSTESIVSVDDLTQRSLLSGSLVTGDRSEQGSAQAVVALTRNGNIGAAVTMPRAGMPADDTMKAIDEILPVMLGRTSLWRTKRSRCWSRIISKSFKNIHHSTCNMYGSSRERNARFRLPIFSSSASAI